MRAISYTAAVLMIVAIGGCSNVEESGQAYERHSAPPSTMSIDRLRCEYLPDPLGIDAISPRLSWIVASEKRAQRQTAYRILAASSPDKLKSNEIDLWDTGKILSDQTTQIAYNGKSLSSGREYFWKVRVWDKAGSASKWSEDASFSMGMLSKDDWKAEWISFEDDSPLDASQQKMVLPPARYYRKSFEASKKVRRAMVYASALGIYELSLNGKPVSDQMFTPGWSDYAKRVYYNTFDVTDLLSRGENSVGAIVADGWYSGYLGYGLLVGYGPNKCGRYIYGKTPAVLIQLEIEYADGSAETVITDTTWKMSTGPLLEADIIMGETYDARLEMPGWNTNAFDDAQWRQAVLAGDNPSIKTTFHDKAGQRKIDLGFSPPPVMQAYSSVPIRQTQKLKPIAISEPNRGTYIFNLGQNFSGIIRLNTKGSAGTKLVMRYGEMLHPDGRLMTENLRKARATDTYILKGDANGETYQSRFTYHGFQFVEVSGLAKKPTLETITGIAVHSDTPLTSSFACSDPMANQLFSNVVWTQRSNFFELPTDCPQRDERFGWTGDAQIYCRTATYNADTAAFFTKWLDDLEEAQLPNGAFPDYAPYPMMHGKPNRGFATAWTDAGVICPYTVYKVYGDTRVIERHWNSMKTFIEFRKKQSPDFLGVNTGNGWGDWLTIGSKTPIEYIDTVYFAYSTKLMQEMALAIGKDADAGQYKELFANIKNAFAKKYIKQDGTLTVDNQTAYVLALSAKMIPDEHIAAASRRLFQLLEKNEFRMTTGFLGTKPLPAVLTDTGYNDLAVRLFQSRQFPSWGYEIENGATSIWERWNSFTKEDGFGNASMNSFSHYAFGAVCQWMFQKLAGIDTDGPGYKEIIIDPHPPTPGSNPEHPPINWVKASYDSIHGRITSNWKRTKDEFILEVSVPANTTATVYLPTSNINSIQESGRPLNKQSKDSGIEAIETQGKKLKIKIASGSYHFTAKLN